MVEGDADGGGEGERFHDGGGRVKFLGVRVLSLGFGV